MLATFGERIYNEGTNASWRSVGEPGKPREARACNYAKVLVNEAGRA